MSAMRPASVAVSASSSRRARSSSPASTASIAGLSPPGASCATVPIFEPRGMATSPDSIVWSPSIARNRVVLPVPFGPTSPTRLPVGIRADAASIRRRPAIRMVMSSSISIWRAYRRGSAYAKAARRIAADLPIAGNAWLGYKRAEFMLRCGIRRARSPTEISEDIRTWPSSALSPSSSPTPPAAT